MKTPCIPVFAALSARLWVVALACVCAGGCAGASRSGETLRPLEFAIENSPSGLAVCYGPFREGQRPDGVQPTRTQVLEDLRIIESRWGLIRTYASRGTTETVLELIREHGLSIRVVVGAWIDSEATRADDGAVIADRPEARAANEAEVRAAIRLANAFPEIVAAVSVGNETQVSWSGHRVDREALIGYIRQVRSAVDVPVTTADDFAFWTRPESVAVAEEVDFIITHAYAMWNGVQLEEAIGFTDEKVRAVRAAHPGRLVVLGETGWATTVHNEGEQARLIKGRAGEPEQARFYSDIRQWARDTRTLVFFFEAFDEPWKGGAHPDEVEKHWGLFNVDRTPKQAMR